MIGDIGVMPELPGRIQHWYDLVPGYYLRIRQNEETGGIHVDDIRIVSCAILRTESGIHNWKYTELINRDLIHHIRIQGYIDDLFNRRVHCYKRSEQVERAIEIFRKDPIEAFFYLTNTPRNESDEIALKAYWHR